MNSSGGEDRVSLANQNVRIAECCRWQKILLVEDDEDIAALLRLNLLDEGYQIVHVADGAQALSLLEKSFGMR